MEMMQPTSWPEALEARAAEPEAVAVAGGTDVLVEINFDRLHPASVLDLGRVRELRAHSRENGHVRLGAGVTYDEIVREFSRDLPSLALAARTVGSPSIRNRGTVGGNLGTASPAGDSHPPLLVSRAEVELSSARASRSVPIDEFFLGPKRSVLQKDELIAAIWLPRATGPQTFSKIGVRNAMVIAVCSFALALYPADGRVRTGIGSAGPVPLRATAAEQFIEGHLAESGGFEHRAPLGESVLGRFGELVAEAARPIDDQRGSESYRRHALGVLARRSLSWCWDEHMREERTSS